MLFLSQPLGVGMFDWTCLFVSVYLTDHVQASHMLKRRLVH
jgi:hypothetical protein